MNIRLNSKEQEELVLKNYRLVYYLANKLTVSPNDYEDIVSIGTIGLIKAAATFNPSKGTRFATYASQCINNEIYMYFRKEKLHIHAISLETPIITSDSNTELTLGNVIISPEQDFTEEVEENDIFIKIINIILNLLKSRERLIMLYKISGASQSFIAEACNLSQSYVSRFERNIIKKVKLYFITQKKFEEVFSMNISDNVYQLSFSTKDIERFNEILANFLKNLKPDYNLPDFKVSCSEERIILQCPAFPESFSFIARIIQEIDNFTLTFGNNKEQSSTKKKTAHKKQNQLNQIEKG